MRKFSMCFIAMVAVGCGGSQTDTAEGPTPDPSPPPAEQPVADQPADPASPADDQPADSQPAPPPEPTTRSVDVASVTWAPLVPDLGDKGPQLAVLFGDPQADGPSGLLIKAPKKFKSTPHVHTNDYRAVVISGMVHEYPHKKKKRGKKLGPGSFWSEPGGAAHNTDCPKGCLAFVQFDGKLDSLPPDQTGDSPGGMKGPIMTPAKKLKWALMPAAPKGGPKMAHAWGDPQNGEPNSFFVQLKAGFPGAMHTHSSDYHAVLIQGRWKHWEPGDTDVAALEPGSYVWQKGGAPHQDACEKGQDCIVYVHMMGKTDAQMVEADAE